MFNGLSVTADMRDYQIKTLAATQCPGCQSLATLLAEHPDAVRLDCYLCGSAYEPNRPWMELVMAIGA